MAVYVKCLNNTFSFAFFLLPLACLNKNMTSELRHREKKTPEAQKDNAFTEEYDGYIKKDMKCSYGKTPSGAGK